jgi:hypothetical protein
MESLKMIGIAKTEYPYKFFNPEVLRPMTAKMFSTKWSEYYEIFKDPYDPNGLYSFYAYNKAEMNADFQNVIISDNGHTHIDELKRIWNVLLNNGWISYVNGLMWGDENGMMIHMYRSEQEDTYNTDLIFEICYENYQIITFEYRPGHDTNRLIKLLNAIQQIAVSLVYEY